MIHIGYYLLVALGGCFIGYGIAWESVVTAICGAPVMLLAGFLLGYEAGRNEGV